MSAEPYLTLIPNSLISLDNISVADARELSIEISREIICHLDKRLLLFLITSRTQLDPYNKLCIQLFGYKHLCLRYVCQIESKIRNIVRPAIRNNVDIMNIQVETLDYFSFNLKKYNFNLNEETMKLIPPDVLIQVMHFIIQKCFDRITKEILIESQHQLAIDIQNNLNGLAESLTEDIKEVQSHSISDIKKNTLILKLQFVSE